MKTKSDYAHMHEIECNPKQPLGPWPQMIPPGCWMQVPLLWQTAKRWIDSNGWRENIKHATHDGKVYVINVEGLGLISKETESGFRFDTPFYFTTKERKERGYEET